MRGKMCTIYIQALEYCSLGHVLSLWVTLSVELARLLTLSDQVRHLYLSLSLMHVLFYFHINYTPYPAGAI